MRLEHGQNINVVGRLRVPAYATASGSTINVIVQRRTDNAISRRQIFIRTKTEVKVQHQNTILILQEFLQMELWCTCSQTTIGVLGVRYVPSRAVTSTSMNRFAISGSGISVPKFKTHIQVNWSLFKLANVKEMPKTYYWTMKLID